MAKNNTVVVGGLSAIGAGLYGLGIPKDSILRYETAIKTGKCVLIAHGSPEETAQAQEVISRTSPELAEHHQPERSPSEESFAGATAGR
jgi:hypothetical protein